MGLIGRTTELDELRVELRRTRLRNFRCVVLEGESGIGKTRLASELLARNRRHTLTLHARGYPFGAASSFGLWAEAFESHLRGLAHEEVAEVCGDALGDLAVILRSASAAAGAANASPPATDAAAPSTPDRGDQEAPSALRLREALAVLLRSLARRQPVVVLLDDLHLADVSSWEALDYLAHNLVDARVFVLGCLRPDELGGLSAPKQVLFRLEQEGLLRRIGVGALGVEELRSLAESVLGHSAVPHVLVPWLSERSGGNPLFAIGLLEALIESGRDLSAPSLDAVPKPLSERLSVRLAAISSDALELIEVLAVAGRRVDLEDLRSFSRRSLTTLARILRGLAEAKLVDEQEQGTVLAYEIAHPLMQEMIYERLGGARRRALHRTIGRALFASSRLGEAAPHLACSAEIGDDEAIGALARAAQEAWSRKAFAESFLVAHSMLELIPSGDDRWLDVLDVLSPGREWLFYEHKEDMDAALGVRIMRQMQRILEGSSDPARLAALNLYLSVFLGWGSGDLDEAVRRGHDAVDQFRQAGDDHLARLAAQELSWVYGVDGDFASQERVASQLLAEAEAAGDTSATVMALRSLASTYWPRGRFEETEAIYQRTIELSSEQHNPTNVVHNHAFLALMLAHEGRLEEASGALCAAATAVPANAANAEEPLVTEVGLLLSLLSGDNDAALTEARRAAAGMGPGQSWVMLVGALAGIEAGETSEARRFVGALAEVIADRRYWMMSLSFRWASGLLTWHEGDLQPAVQMLDAVSSDLVDIDAVAVAGPVLVDLAEASAEAGQDDVLFHTAARLDHLARRVDRDHHRAFAAIGAGWAALAVGESDEAVKQARRAADHFAISGYRMYQARALDLVGRASAADDRHSSSQALKQAIRLFDACSARWRRARIFQVLGTFGRHGRRTLAALARPSPLTARERQVAALAVEGLTAREIGQRLYIGERTVETHLANIYAKYGVHSRVELLRHASELASE